MRKACTSPHQGSTEKQHMWSLLLEILSLAREIHIQILNDSGIISEQSDPMVNSISRMLLPCRSSRLDKGVGRWAPCPPRVWFGRQDKVKNTVQSHRSEERKQIL